MVFNITPIYTILTTPENKPGWLPELGIVPSKERNTKTFVLPQMGKVRCFTLSM